MAQSKPVADIIDHSSKDTGHGIDVLAEYERDFVDENVSQYTSYGTCDCSHYDVYPYREAGSHTAFNTDHGKKAYSDSVKDKECIVELHD